MFSSIKVLKYLCGFAMAAAEFPTSRLYNVTLALSLARSLAENLSRFSLRSRDSRIKLPRFAKLATFAATFSPLAFDPSCVPRVFFGFPSVPSNESEKMDAPRRIERPEKPARPIDKASETQKPRGQMGRFSSSHSYSFSLVLSFLFFSIYRSLSFAFTLFLSHAFSRFYLERDRKSVV